VKVHGPGAMAVGRTSAEPRPAAAASHLDLLQLPPLDPHTHARRQTPDALDTPFYPASAAFPLDLLFPAHFLSLCSDRHTHTSRDTMLATGRGSIALVQYSGDEAAPEIKKLLDAVVSHCQPLHTALRVH
jgi:hypothetical protein